MERQGEKKVAGSKSEPGILGISNRTENWKTARYFAPFFGHGAKRVAEHLSGEPVESNVRLELYWKGMRDFLKKEKDKEKWKVEIADRFRNSELFGTLQERVSGFRVPGIPGFQKLKPHNYDASNTKGIYRNLYNTEIDIVLESRHALFIGEAQGGNVPGCRQPTGARAPAHQAVRDGENPGRYDRESKARSPVCCRVQ